MRSLNLLLLFAVMILFTRCSGQTNSAMEDQKKAYEALAATASPGEAPSAAIYLKATINGAPWTASRMVRDPDYRSSYYIVTGEGKGLKLGFYVYYRRIHAGDILNFGSDMAYIIQSDGGQSYDGRKTGKVTITKVDQDGFEGTFYFTATSTDYPEVYTVTNGSFRVPYVKGK